MDPKYSHIKGLHNISTRHRGSYTIAHVFLNLLNELRKRDKKLAKHFIPLSQRFNKFNNTGA